ncbi:MAG: Spy/CpxP family protein refolding chaperone [Gomphosphaeria aponina SAG 52.96 = DSM 107014]|uniref:Spy/CpxP family protein refolding chaperone n=1 Tax=Gomphosphaeria aponina SAG 52.96 = DSM 107014 TaxID=1521640 RepID=A0A941JKT7_9CHRO|nr:Spy/CpxP family protein refolding chaperone [Gomphosphaeria aponina SAG 52.96 = DSM 107014]
MKLNSLLIFTVFIPLSFGSNIVNANPLPNANIAHHQLLKENPHGDRLLEQLNLTEEQKQQMEAIRQKYQEQISQNMENLRLAQQELQQMMTATNSNDSLRAQHQEILQLRQEVDTLRFESMLELREVLTPEQRHQFASMMQQHRHSFRNPAAK